MRWPGKMGSPTPPLPGLAAAHQPPNRSPLARSLKPTAKVEELVVVDEDVVDPVLVAVREADLLVAVAHPQALAHARLPGVLRRRRGGERGMRA